MIRLLEKVEEKELCSSTPSSAVKERCLVSKKSSKMVFGGLECNTEDDFSSASAQKPEAKKSPDYSGLAA